MDKVVIWTESALDDVDQIADYISRDSASYAASFVQNVLDKAATLSLHAERCAVVTELQNESIREFFVHRFRVIFRISDDAVRILRVIHGSRDLPRNWDKES